MSTPHPDDELLAAYTANELSVTERTAFEAHQAVCWVCARALRQTQSIRARLRTLEVPSGGVPEPSVAEDVFVRLGIADASAVSSPPDRALFGMSSLPSSESTACLVSAPRRVMGATSQSDVPRETSIQPTGAEAAGGGSLRRSRQMELRTREIPDSLDGPDSTLPALAERTRAIGHAPVHVHRSRPFVAVAAVVALALLSAALFGMLGPRLPRGPARGGFATATSVKPTATPVQMPGLVIDQQTGLPADLKNTTFSSVQTLGPNDLWGLGSFWQTPQGKTSLLGVEYTFFGHFDGRRWRIWPVPLANISLNSFSMDSDTDGWAVGSLTSVDFAHGVLTHFADGTITLLQVPGAGALSGVQMVSATEGWAVGNAPSDGTQPPGVPLDAVTLHYIKGAWSVAANTLYPEGALGLSLDSAADGWIVSGEGHLGRLAGGRWEQWPQTYAGDYLSSVSAGLPDDAWVVGRTGGSPTSEPAPVVLHFDGHSWTRVTIPALMQSAGAMLSQIVMISPRDGWIAGELLGPLSTTQPQGETAVLLHYDGSQWRSVAPPDGVEFSSISMSSSADGWAMAWNPPSGSHTYLCHYQNGVWSTVTRFG